MPSTLAEQLRSLPLVSTVLRTDFDLASSDSFVDGRNLLEGWVLSKCAALEIRPDWDRNFASIGSGHASLEHARTDDGFAFVLSHPDSHQEEESDWIAEVSLRRKSPSEPARFSTRLRMRQARESRQPLPRAPKFVGDLVRQVGAKDASILSGEPVPIDASTFEDLNGLLISKRRNLPVLVISEDPNSGEIAVDASEIARYLTGIAHVAVISGQASWMLTNRYGQERSTFNAAVRCYMPGFQDGDDQYKHKLWLREAIRRADALSSKGFLNSCLRHLFAVVTAQFEPYPFLTPAALRRQAPEVISPVSAAILLPIIVDEARPISAPETDASAATLVAEPSTAPIEAGPLTIDESHVEILEATFARLAELEMEVVRLEKMLQEARDETAQKNRELTELQPIIQEVEDLRDEIRLLRGEYESKESPVLIDYWAGFNLFFVASKNLADQFERTQKQLRESEHTSDERDQYREELSQQKQRLFYIERRLAEVETDNEPRNRPILFPETWETFLKAEEERMEWLAFFDTPPDDLLSCPFETSIAKEVDDVLDVLNYLGRETKSDGSFTEEGQRMYQEHFFKKNAWFSDESDFNKTKHESRMTFSDPDNPSRNIFCPWHGKINQKQFRVHFEWPRPEGQRKIKVLYIGPKLTKQ